MVIALVMTRRELAQRDLGMAMALAQVSLGFLVSQVRRRTAALRLRRRR